MSKNSSNNLEVYGENCLFIGIAATREIHDRLLALDGKELTTEIVKEILRGNIIAGTPITYPIKKRNTEPKYRNFWSGTPGKVK